VLCAVDDLCQALYPHSSSRSQRRLSTSRRHGPREMVQMKSRVIFSDIDGTLAHPVEGPMTVVDTGKGTLTCSLNKEVRCTHVWYPDVLNSIFCSNRFCKLAEVLAHQLSVV
jgi:hypothetical protein